MGTACSTNHAAFRHPTKLVRSSGASFKDILLEIIHAVEYRGGTSLGHSRRRGAVLLLVLPYRSVQQRCVHQFSHLAWRPGIPVCVGIPHVQQYLRTHDDCRYRYGRSCIQPGQRASGAAEVSRVSEKGISTDSSTNGQSTPAQARANEDGAAAAAAPEITEKEPVVPESVPAKEDRPVASQSVLEKEKEPIQEPIQQSTPEVIGTTDGGQKDEAGTATTDRPGPERFVTAHEF